MDRKNIADLFPLSPMQQALLFHSVHAGTPDPGFLQLRGTLRGMLEVETYARAWQQVIDRHPALRTSVHWRDLEKPLQVVFREVHLPWAQEDWRALPVAAQQARLEAYLAADRQRGFDLSQVPALRLALFQAAEDRWHFVWSCHHVLLDGWSGALVLEEVAACYEALRGGTDAGLPAARPYRDYVAWLQRQDAREAEAFWREALAGVQAPTPLPFDTPAAGGARVDRSREAVLDRTSTAALERFARQNRLTLGTLVQGAWALLLGLHSGEEDVVFGTTVSGRTADVPGIASMVGLFINTLPVRVRVARDASLRDVLAALQDHQAAVSRYEHTPPAQVQAWSGVPGHRRLFESLLVFENFPWNVSKPSRAGTLQVEDFSGDVTTNYPLTLVVAPGEGLSLQVRYDGRRFTAERVDEMLRSLRLLLEHLTGDPGCRVAELLVRLRPAGGDGGAPLHTANGVARRPSRERPPEEPRDALELQLVQIWEQVLGVHPIGIHDGFFELGGHSLHAARLFQEVERRLGRKLPLATLFQLSTVAQLARALRDDGWTPPWSSLVPIQPEGTRPPLYCVHGWLGNVLFYRALGRRLAPDQPVYGLQAIGLDGTTPPPTRIEDMAAPYLHEIRTLQPEGPYYLLGRCFGAMIALEMARQLQDIGEDVAALFVLDSIIPGEEATGTRVARVLRRYAQLPLRKGRETFARRFGTPEQRQAQYFHDRMKIAWKRYTLPVFHGPVTIFLSTEFATQVNPDRHVERWSELATGGAVTYIFPGDHTNILEEPRVQAVADRLRSCLDEACVPVTEADRPRLIRQDVP